MASNKSRINIKKLNTRILFSFCYTKSELLVILNNNYITYYYLCKVPYSCDPWLNTILNNTRLYI